MSFPAYRALGRDIQLGFSHWRVYMHLVHAPILNHVTPVWVKSSALEIPGRGERPLTRGVVAKSLDWLVRRGYVVQYARDAHGVRSLALAFEVAPESVVCRETSHSHHEPSRA